LHLLFFDPTHQIHNTINGKCWQTKGKEGTVLIQSNSGRKRISILGALNAVTAKCSTLITEDNCDKDMIKAALQTIRNDYKDNKSIVLILDNASYNRAYETKDFAKNLNIQLKYLPTYSPNLNLIERFWKFYKKLILKNKFYNSFADFLSATFSFFKNINIYDEEIKNFLNHKFEILKEV
jgi:transposase